MKKKGRKLKKLCRRMNVQWLMSLLWTEPSQEIKQARSLIGKYLMRNPHLARMCKPIREQKCLGCKMLVEAKEHAEEKGLLENSNHAGVEENKQLDVSESSDECKEIYDVSDEELLMLCSTEQDRSAAKRVMGDLRKYLDQVSKSEGFDIDVYPGHINGLTFISPLDHTSWKRCHVDCVYMAKLAIASFNQNHLEEEYEVVRVQKANVMHSVVGLFYVTFQARDRKAIGHENGIPHKTFQACVAINMLQLDKGEVCFCRLKA